MLFEELKAFIAVINHRSLSRAARELSLTQSAVSRRVQHLEEVLGGLLFDRNTRPPLPTALARRVYEEALPIMQGAKRLIQITRGEEVPAGSFRLGVSRAVETVVSYEMVKRLHQEFPSLDLTLDTDWSPVLHDHLQKGALDVITVLMRSPGALPSGMHGRFIATADVVIVQSKRAALALPGDGIADLAVHEWILNPVGCGFRNALEKAIGRTGQTIKLRVDTADTELQLRLVADGLGLGLVLRAAFEQSSYFDSLMLVDLHDFSLQLDIWMVHADRTVAMKLPIDTIAEVLVAAFSPSCNSVAAPEDIATFD